MEKLSILIDGTTGDVLVRLTDAELEILSMFPDLDGIRSETASILKCDRCRGSRDGLSEPIRKDRLAKMNCVYLKNNNDGNCQK